MAVNEAPAMEVEGSSALNLSGELASEHSAYAVPHPLIAVVVPVYKQAPYLKDAVMSAVNQTLRNQTKVVIVNDGCPYPSTDWLGRFFRDALPETVFYLKKRNGGLSSARNYGIRFALAAWPSIQAVFPLDADDRLSETTLERLWQKLARSEPDIGWVYQDLVFFGIEEGTYPTGLPFSLYRLVHQNYCASASLIHRRVFEAGVWYDEGMTGGYEDWEFFVHAGLRSFRGAHVAETGFLYRKHGHSMLKDAQAKHEAIYDYIRTKHRQRLTQSDLALLEHSELPRFALIAPDADKVSFFTIPGLPEACEVDLASYADALATGTATPTLDAPYVPPITIFARRELLDFLNHLRVLPGLLFRIQKRVARLGYAFISLDVADDPYLIDVDSTPTSREPVLFAISSRKLVEQSRRRGGILDQLAGRDARSATQFLKVGKAFFTGDHERLLPGAGSERKASLSHVAKVASRLSSALSTKCATSMSRRRQEDLVSHSGFAAWMHLDQGSGVFPYSSAPGNLAHRQISIFFTLPWFGLGGVDQCVLNLARELSNLRSAYRVHLVITESSRMEADPDWLSTFDTIRWLPSDVSERELALFDALGGADVVINANSPLCYRMLPELRMKGTVSFFSYLHGNDLDTRGVPCGYPIIASREYANLIDRFIVISEQLRRFCLNSGVPEEKILVVRNAPAVSPASREVALHITKEKCRRSFSQERPIKILFAGRFDYQKGVDRVEMIAIELSVRGLPYEMQLVGKQVLSSGPEPSHSIPNMRVLPAVIDRDVLAKYYRDADVFLLPSRWEGVPLTALEAMSFGNVVIATRVGAIGEIVESGKSGFLIETAEAEEKLVREFCRIIGDMVDDPRRYDNIRLQACTRAMDSSWAQSAGTLARLIDEVANPLRWS